MSYIWDYKIAGLDVRMYHATSVIVHILVGVSLFWLFYLVTERRGLSLVGALLYTVHPLHTEAVSYISGRADPLMALFMLWAFGLYIMSRKRTRPVLLILSYMCYVGALLSKEYALILPIFLILYHMSFHEKIPWKNLIGFFALGLLFLVVRSNLVESSHDPAFIPPSFLERIPGIFVAFVQYLKLIFWPVGLHMEYGGKYFDYSYGLMWVGLTVFIGFLTILKQSKKKNPLVFFGLSWFLIGLIPHSNIIPLNAYMAEHWLYVPLMGFVLAFVCVVDQFKIPPLSKSIAGGVLICLLGVLTCKQNQIWRTPVVLYEHTLKYSRDSSRIMNNLGVIYFKQGQKEKAIRLFENAISGRA
ncbi:hypothetical protein IIB34_06130 [PVC group bacterium]|nr:hypothetical protein [PVC group bacterium]